MIVIVPVGVLADRTDPRLMLLVGTIALIVAQLCMLLVPTPGGFILAAMMFGLAGTNTGLSYALFGVVSRQNKLRNALGTFRLCGDLGLVLGPFLMGSFVQQFNNQAALVGAVSI